MIPIQRLTPSHRPIPPALRLVFGLAILVILGTLILMLPISASDQPLAWNEALFTATSALSVTGLSIITPVTALSPFGQIVLLTLIQIGGVGFMVVAVVILRLLGRKVSLVDRLTLSDSLGLLVPGAIVSLTRRVLVTVGIIEGLGALLLFLHWRQDARLSIEQAAFFAIFHAVSAFCNAGFDLFSGTPGFPDGIPRDNFSLIILGSLIFIGGLGIPVIADVLTYYRDHRLSLHTRLTLIVVSFLVISGMVGFFVAERRLDVGALRDEPVSRQLLITLFQSISSRTAGFAGIADFSDLTPPSKLLMITLMFIGCPPASMGGGITTGTFAILTISLWGFARGLPTPQFAGRSLATGTARRAAAVLTISLFVVLLSTWLILITHKEATLDVAVFEVVSAFATCGLTLNFTSELNLFGQIVIALVMFWGRLGALTIVIALAQPGRTQLVSYPEEQILIG
ncbi:TrkH family potassium uptake protein [Candidatus Oscillochloris fontis]|uniref:TrkH family potassium uptake protein n=1 Tax=Candidatus Oscillochloris fontis TaxID=2496868 RepID=UPI001EE8B736|nr:potassium transporter TrkG [Candidatus Oscillochloris fontis]